MSEDDLEPELRGWPLALICDLDGTLVDSLGDITSAANRALLDLDIQIDIDQARRWLGDGAQALMARALEHAQVAHDDALLESVTAEFSAYYAQRPGTETRCYAGVEKALEQLRKQGMRIAVCTNKPEEIAQQVLQATGLVRYVDALVGGGRYPLKPAPDAILACMDALGCTAEDTLYVGDMRVDRDAARASGLPVILAEFGYSQTPVAELEPDAVLPRWADIQRVLERLAAR